MIIICEPIARGSTHEKVNSGFIYGLHLAYPQETIRFYADITHIEAIKNILDHDAIIIDNIEYIPVKFRNLYSIRGIVKYYSPFDRILKDAIEVKVNKIFFFSFNPVILYALKQLKRKSDYHEMKFTFVLHGSFDTVANENDKPDPLSLPIKKIKNQNDIKYKLRILRHVKIAELPHVFASFFNKFMPWQLMLKKVFTDRKMMLWKHSADYRYIALSTHIIENAARYLNVKEMNMYTVILPTVFRQPSKQPENEYVKFAIFGYGNPLILHNILVKLSQKNLKNNYEIRIIGMDNRGTSEFLNVTCPSPGKRLDRNEMEKYAEDIDAFLILYDKTRYRLSCTGSILESLSYTKPILHFDNDCINAFNRNENPIGIRCSSLDEFVCKMENIIENYDSYQPEFQKFRNNILKLRNECTIENSLITLKESFTW
ncbi:hypothetical protein [Methanolobus profundi]|uniref:Uncharacterized protein n=1 Tax=Methanolobus profundi TaxID=487685 RepID=A0A1I4UJJ4_9EURY|nr:hypothetical protein [Methanolobus profundi]SFM89182.1 hypothetical protein SAMN04488696_2748 [Methanolobus profundi]